MSLKNVELQVALPRTLENSRHQQQLQHQNTLQNAQASEELAARTVRAEQSVQNADVSARAALRDRREQNKGSNKNGEGHPASGEESGEAELPHPYKGHRLDIKL